MSVRGAWRKWSTDILLMVILFSLAGCLLLIAYSVQASRSNTTNLISKLQAQHDIQDTRSRCFFTLFIQSSRNGFTPISEQEQKRCQLDEKLSSPGSSTTSTSKSSSSSTYTTKSSSTSSTPENQNNTSPKPQPQPEPQKVCAPLINLCL